MRSIPRIPNFIMYDTSKSQGTVIRRGLRCSAGILAIAALTLGSLTNAADENKSTALGLQMTATPVFNPGTTVTPIPGLSVPPSGPAFRARQVLEGLLLGLLWVCALFVAFNRPGAWTLRNVLEVLIGFLGWFLANTFLWNWIIQNESGAIFLNPARLIPLLVNVGSVLAFFRLGRWVVLGLICAILANAVGLLLFPAPTTDIIHTDPTLERVIAMMPFYVPFFFFGL